MSFLGEINNIVTKKDTDRAMRINDGQVQDSKSVLDVDVAASVERGLLGITISNQNIDNKTYVFLFLLNLEEERMMMTIQTMWIPKAIDYIVMIL